mgnify:CR=1 FL=1
MKTKRLINETIVWHPTPFIQLWKKPIKTTKAERLLAQWKMITTPRRIMAEIYLRFWESFQRLGISRSTLGE